METLSGLHRHCGRRKPRTSEEEGGRSVAVRGAHREHREVDRLRVTEQLSIPVAEESWSGGLGRRHVRVVLVIGSLAFDELALLEGCSGSDEGHEVGALTARQRCWAGSISLNAIAVPATFEPGPLVTLVRCRTVAKVDSR